MGFELYKKEQAVIDTAKDLADSGLFGDEAKARDEFGRLLKDYEKLFKSTKRLVRMSDRNEEELNALAKSLDEKNTMLEGLSSKLSKYLSPQVYESIFEGSRDVQLNTERKKLTVFFSDIKNFTQTTEDMQPEDLTWLLNKYFTEMSKIALDHGATIDKFIGDAILAFFGDPETKGIEEDARAAVRMALAMQRRLQDLEIEWREKGFEKPFKMRVGLNTGFCNVGNFGSESRMDYTIIGGEVNLAARLESQADPGGILMSYETYALVQDIVDAEEREAITAKGIRREVRPFAVKGIYEGEEGRSRYIRRKSDGLTLMLDKEKLVGDTAAAAIADMEKAIEELRKRV